MPVCQNQGWLGGPVVLERRGDAKERTVNFILGHPRHATFTAGTDAMCMTTKCAKTEHNRLDWIVPSAKKGLQGR